MRVGVFSVLYQQYPFEQALDKIAAAGASTVEIGTGGLPGGHHCNVDEVLASAEKRTAYLKAIESRGIIIGAMSCHCDPISPDAQIAQESDAVFRKSVELAEKLGVPVVNVLAELPTSSPTDTQPNWETCPWPPHFLEILDYQWNQVAIPYWRGAAEFAEVL